MTLAEHPASPESAVGRRAVPRRTILAAGAATAALSAVGCGSGQPSVSLSDRQAASNADSGGDGDTLRGDYQVHQQPRSPVSPEAAGRTLVIVNLEGGNDGLATLEPYGAGRLADLRPELMHDPAELVILDDQVGLNPSLAGLHDRGLAVIEGVGIADGDLSHFEMEKRWDHGHIEAGEGWRTGFLGRLCDEIDIGAPLTGLSLGNRGWARAMVADRSITTGLTNPDAGWFFREDGPWFSQFRRSVLAMGQPSTPASGSGADPAIELLPISRRGIRRSVDFADMLGGVFDRERFERYPSGDLGRALAATAGLIRAESGLRIVHLTHGGFDTHDNQMGRHDYLMMKLNDALAAFHDDLAEDGLNRSTLVATVSEFGRRPRASESGTDHGNASVALLSGPVTPGRHGQAPSLQNLDANDNLAPTVSLGEYYATLASWMGVDPQLVLGQPYAPVGGVIT